MVVILVAYLVKSGRRHLLGRIWTGVGIAVAISLGFGALLTYGPKGLTFEAQEAIGGGLSIIAVGFVTWMIFWMARSSRTMSTELKAAIDAAEASRRSLVLVAMLAVGREGLETALFLWAATKAAARDNASTTAPLLGALLGLLTAVALGVAVYRGAVKLDLGRFFRWTGGFLVLIAGGVLAYAVHDLQEARILPGLHNYAFDLSARIDPSGWFATLLKGIFNFSPAMTVLEVAVWLLYVIPVMAWFVHNVRPARPSAPTPTPAGTEARTTEGVPA
ncbi:FTR1 family protein [Luteococcus peritonei]